MYGPGTSGLGDFIGRWSLNRKVVFYGGLDSWYDNPITAWTCNHAGQIVQKTIPGCP